MFNVGILICLLLSIPDATDNLYNRFMNFHRQHSQNIIRVMYTVLKFYNKLCFHVTFGYVWTRLQLWSSRKFKVYLTLNKIVSQWQSCIFEFWWRYRLRNISHTSISAVSQVQRRRSRMNKMWGFWSSWWNFALENYISTFYV